MGILDSYFIVGNYKADPLIEIYDKSSKEKIKSFLRVGRGPLEASFLGYMQMDPAQNGFYISDLFKRTLLRYDLKEVLADPFSHPELIYSRGNESLLFTKIGVLNDGYLVAESQDPKGKFLLMDKTGKQLQYFRSFPAKELVDDNLNDIQNAGLYTAAMTVNPSKDKAALASYNAGLIDLVQLKNGRLDSIWSYQAFYPSHLYIAPMGEDIMIAYTQESRNGFLGIHSTDEYVYCLFSGKTKNKDYKYGTEVYVVSWDGKETYKIVLDQKVNRLIADKDNRTMYGITPDMDILRFTFDKN
ncbi:MAG: hypothetical protein J1F42_12430 [Lachnospiraceae bacterium]|nr:hypothetical protein [Lachnospiraceae bacterium]